MERNIASLTKEQSWFSKAKFGIFVHFGLYTLLGGNENDFHGKSPLQYREELMPRFNPQQFDADRWITMFAEAGAEYVTFTTKHGEGFCLWHTETTDYHVGNTPFGRDIVGEISDACHRRGLRLGLYCASDNWYYSNSGRYELTADAYSEFYRRQLHELMKRYGQVDELWFDGSTPMFPPERLETVIAELHVIQPTLVVNDRAVDHDHVNKMYGDFVTPERFFPVRTEQNHPYIEVCDAMGIKGWGFHADEHFHSSPVLIHRLCKAASLGGNYLLNVEPQPDGRIRPECTARLQAIGGWLRKNRKSIFDTEGCRLVPYEITEQNKVERGCCTLGKNSIYIHFSEWPQTDEIYLEGISATPVSASLSGIDLQFEQNDDVLCLRRLPAKPVNNAVVHVKYGEAPRISGSETFPVTRVRASVPTLLQPTAAVLLPSADGVTHHQIEKYENGTISIGRWVRTDSAAEWHLDVEKGGRYLFFAYLGTGEQQAGAVAVFAIGGSTLSFTSVTTASYKEPYGHAIGILDIPAGTQSLKLCCKEKKQFFPNVYHLILFPVGTGQF